MSSEKTDCKGMQGKVSGETGTLGLLAAKNFLSTGLLD